ncbi:MAG: ATP-binding cassette domain-containing protein [bacterium]|nr:ATP-binding cassette domain-containing protein [bacterium]
MPSCLIEAHDLTREFRVAETPEGFLGGLRGFLKPRYRLVQALAGASFRIDRGEAVGYIGLNGAGKSTTIKLLCGILAPTRGRVTVAGIDPHRRRLENAGRIGLVVGQRTQLWWDLPVRESFQLLRRVYRVPLAAYRANVALFHDLLDLGSIWNTPVRLLSLGQRMRADLAAVFLHDPPMVYLDEPTIGLDVLAKAAVRQFLKEINRTRGVTLLLATHDLRDLALTCPRVLMVHRGRILYDGGQEELLGRYGQEVQVVAELERQAPPFTLPGVSVLRQDAGRLEVVFNRRSVPVAAVLAAVTESCPVRDLSVREADLESIVQRLYGGDRR